MDTRGSCVGWRLRGWPGAHGGPVAAVAAAGPACQAWRMPAQDGHAAHAGQSTLSAGHRLPVPAPAAAARVPAVAHCVWLLSCVPERGRVGVHASPPRGPAARRPRKPAACVVTTPPRRSSNVQRQPCRRASPCLARAGFAHIKAQQPRTETPPGTQPRPGLRYLPRRLMAKFELRRRNHYEIILTMDNMG